MENKKKAKADLTKKRGLFMVIGLVMSMSLTLMAFEWKFYGEGEIMAYQGPPDDWEVMPEVPITKQPPPKPPVQQPVLIEIPDEVDIEDEIPFVLDIDPTVDDIISSFGDMEDPPDEEPVDQIFLVVEEAASFPGGKEAWGKFLHKNFKYPRKAQRMGVEGNVYLSFVVDQQGLISDIQVTRGIGGGCDEEAIRVLEKSPKWNPGKQRGRAVKSRMAIKIAFQLR